VFYPETTDIYEKKNMPKAVFCLHALAAHLNRRRLAPAIRNVFGDVQFAGIGYYLDLKMFSFSR
jgi:hypothetical protein